MLPFSYFDAHCDTLSRCLREGWSLWENPGHLDLRRLSAYPAAGQVFALYLDGGRDDLPQRLEKLRAMEAMLRAARTAYPQAADCRLSLEGAESIGCDESLLPELARWGVRWINLTWNDANELSGSCLTGEGLTDRGRRFVRAMDAAGILADVSHLSDRGFWDLLETTDRPVLASHSDCRSLYGHPRNLTDEMAEAIFRRGGFVGVNFSIRFLGGDPSADRVTDHLERLLELGGADHVGFGSDFDGTDVPPDLSGAETLPRLWEAMLRRNWSEALIQKITYGNLAGFLEKTNPYGGTIQ